MSAREYPYVIVGGSLAAASAVEGIRQLDSAGGILMICREKHLPYHRPPLSKQLWTGKKTVEKIFVNSSEFYEDNGVHVMLSAVAESLDPGLKIVTDDTGRTWKYGKLLLATGGIPHRLNIPGGDLRGLCYFRTLDDYNDLRSQAVQGATAVVIGGGFIGSELAAALNVQGVSVTMIFPGEGLCDRVFPTDLSLAMRDRYRQRGVEFLAGDRPATISRHHGGKWHTQTQNGREVESDIVVAGVGIEPAMELARMAGLRTVDGVMVNEYLQTSHPDVYASGDNAFFPYAALGRGMRIEHWDNALSQGRQAGRNMSGAHEPFTYMPYFFSDLFEFGYEAVGDVDAGLDTYADWEKQNDTGVIYYLQDHKVRGVMMCNVWNKVEAARAMIHGGQSVAVRELAGAIR
jgi:NAD(P)H-nitrite reductase large subunit